MFRCKHCNKRLKMQGNMVVQCICADAIKQERTRPRRVVYNPKK